MIIKKPRAFCTRLCIFEHHTRIAFPSFFSSYGGHFSVDSKPDVYNRAGTIIKYYLTDSLSSEKDQQHTKYTSEF
jgi:hypothetical protein